MNTFLIIIYLALIILIVFMIKKNISNRKRAREKYSHILADLYYKLKLKSVEDIVLKEDFVVKKVYFKSIRPGKYVTEHIESLANEILNYLDIKNNIDIVVLYDDNDRYSSTKEKVAYYRSNKRTRDIHIIVKKDYTCTDVVAILCHEISHLYMELMDIKYKDLKQNEEATDVTAILLGFGKIMIKGYVECSREESTGFNTSIIHKSKIGYISSRDCKIVYRLTKRIKEFELLKRQEKILLDETKKKTKEKIELSKQLYDNFIIVSQNRPATFVQQEDMLKMQDLYNKIENGYFSVQIRQFEMKVSKELSQEDLEEINKKIDLFCYEITMYNSFFSKH